MALNHHSFGMVFMRQLCAQSVVGFFVSLFFFSFRYILCAALDSAPYIFHKYFALVYMLVGFLKNISLVFKFTKNKKVFKFTKSLQMKHLRNL